MVPLCSRRAGQIVCDGGPVVAGIVHFVVSRRRSLRLLSRLVERSAPATTALIVVNAVRCFVGVRCPRGRGVLVVARRPNERREVEALRRLVPGVAWTPVAFEWRPAAMLDAFQSFTRPLSALRRTARLARWFAASGCSGHCAPWKCDVGRFRGAIGGARMCAGRHDARRADRPGIRADLVVAGRAAERVHENTIRALLEGLARPMQRPLPA